MTAMKLKHRTPCNECPWRRVAPAGWLGGYQPEEFTTQVHRDGPPLPCHKTIPRGETMAATSRRVSMCAGALVHMRNSCKSAQHPDYGDALGKVERDTATVFQFAHEFLEHHRDPDAWANQVAERLKGGGK